MSFPIRAYGKYVDIISLYVVNLLTKIFLYDYLIGKPGFTHIFNTLHYIVAYIQLATIQIKIIGSYPYYQIIAQSFGTPEQIDVSLM